MESSLVGRELRGVLVEVGKDAIRVIFSLGDASPVRPVEWISYGVDVFSKAGDQGIGYVLWFGVDGPTKASVVDHNHAVQANYDESVLTVSEDKIEARFHDASLGLRDIGNATGWSAVNGKDVTPHVPAHVLA